MHFVVDVVLAHDVLADVALAVQIVGGDDGSRLGAAADGDGHLLFQHFVQVVVGCLLLHFDFQPAKGGVGGAQILKESSLSNVQGEVTSEVRLSSTM